MGLTSIANRLTPSTPIELTFGAQLAATGKKFTTLFGHRAASGGSGVDYESYTVANVGDPDAAKLEVDALAGAGSQLGKMAYAFVAENAFAGRSNFPAFHVILIPSAQAGFGPADEAIVTAKSIRSDMLVSCYPASDATNRTKLLNLQSLISGPDRDLQGQFGSFVMFASLDALSTAVAYNVNSRGAVIAYLQDTNTALVEDVAGTTTTGSNKITGIITTGINVGAQVSGTGIPAGALVGSLDGVSVTLVDSSGNPVNATATSALNTFDFQNVVSQPVEIVAACHAAMLMSLAFPYNPVQGVASGYLKSPKKKSDIIQVDPNGASEQALAAGLSPLTILPGNIVGYIRSRTSYTTLPSLVPANAYFDWQDLVVLNDFREVCFGVCQNPPFNNNPGGTKASKQIAAKLKDEILREAFDFETRGAFQNVNELAKFFSVEVSSQARGRFDFRVPEDVIPGLYVIAGNIVGVIYTNDFTL